MSVPGGETSHTYGVNALISAEATLRSGIHWETSNDLLVDWDHDKLDPDHIPVWWRLHGAIDGPIRRPTGPWHVSWVTDLDATENTVSSIEREIRAMGGVTAGCVYGPFSADLKAQLGYFFLEIDDDVPKLRGYTRADLRNDGVAVSLALDAAFEITPVWKLSGHVQQWNDDVAWLQKQYLLALQYRLAVTGREPCLTLSVEVNDYNLDPYYPAGATGPYLPILPSGRDRLVKLFLSQRW